MCLFSQLLGYNVLSTGKGFYSPHTPEPSALSQKCSICLENKKETKQVINTQFNIVWRLDFVEGYSFQGMLLWGVLFVCFKQQRIRVPSSLINQPHDWTSYYRHWMWIWGSWQLLNWRECHFIFFSLKCFWEGKPRQGEGVLLTFLPSSDQLEVGGSGILPLGVTCHQMLMLERSGSQSSWQSTWSLECRADTPLCQARPRHHSDISKEGRVKMAPPLLQHHRKIRARCFNILTQTALSAAWHMEGIRASQRLWRSVGLWSLWAPCLSSPQPVWDCIGLPLAQWSGWLYGLMALPLNIPWL